MRMHRRSGAPQLSGPEFEARLRRWADVTELGLGLRGAVLLGRRGRTWRRCVAAGLREANRLRDEQTIG